MPSISAPSELTCFRAVYYDGHSANRYDVFVTFDLNAMRVAAQDEREVDRWVYDDIELSDHGSGGLRVIKRGSEARLVFDDPRAFKVIHARAPNLTSHNRRVLRNMGLAVALTMMIVIGGYFALPLLSSAIVPLIPYETEARLGDKYADDMAVFFAPETDGRRCETPDGRQTLDAIVARLAQGGTGPFAYRVEVLDTDTVNAIALPGGHIFVLRGLLDEAESEGEVVGVIAHEMAHVDRRHGMDALVRSYGVDMLANLMFGGSVMGSVSTYMMSASYSRDNEHEADMGAIERLGAVGLSADGMARFFGRLHEKESKRTFNVPDLLSTHPPSDVRQALLVHSGDTQESSGRVLTLAQWQALKGICGQD